MWIRDPTKSWLIKSRAIFWTPWNMHGIKTLDAPESVFNTMQIQVSIYFYNKIVPPLP